MIEATDLSPQGIDKPPELDHQETLIMAGRLLQPISLELPQKAQILTAVSATLFPEKAEAFKTVANMTDDEYRKTVKSVFYSPGLYTPYVYLVCRLTQDPHKLGLTRGIVDYSNTWEKRGRIGQPEAERRLLIVLEEHRQKYPGIPVNLTTLGLKIGDFSKQWVHKIWKELEKRGQIPEDISKLPQGARHRNVSA